MAGRAEKRTGQPEGFSLRSFRWAQTFCREAGVKFTRLRTGAVEKSQSGGKQGSADDRTAGSPGLF
jgi:hypothetical protein